MNRRASNKHLPTAGDCMAAFSVGKRSPSHDGCWDEPCVGTGQKEADGHFLWGGGPFSKSRLRWGSAHQKDPRGQNSENSHAPCLQ